MYNIAICDDQPICADTLELSVKAIMDEKGIEYNVDVYNSGTQLLESIRNNKKYDILFLDIILAGEELNGMILAKNIREFDDNVTIVFCTSSADYVLEGYSVRALQYLLKPIDINVLREIFEYELKNRESKFLVLKCKEGTKKILLEEIIHIETLGRNIKVVLNGNEIVAFNKISDVEKMISAKNFIRCHQSFIINVEHIKELNHYEVLTANDEWLPVSRTQWGTLRKLFK